MQRIFRRRAQGLFRTLTGGAICLSTIAITLMTSTPSNAQVVRAEKSRQRDNARVSKRAARATGVITRKPAWTTTTTSGAVLRAGLGNESVILTVDGGLYMKPPGGSVASPIGSTYSVHHRVGAMIDNGNGPEQTCFDIGSINDPTDYVVAFDGVTEPLRQNIFGTIATVIESDTPQPDGSRLIVITTSSPTGTDLFPGGVFIGPELTDACFTIGLDDPLSWEGLDTVVQADIAFLTDGAIQTTGDVTALFSSPWDGIVDVALVNAAGLGYNGIRLEIRTNKSITPANDLCDDRIAVTDGLFTYSTIGASTDGLESSVCSFNGFPGINADIWYSYNATCTGDMIVELCGSAYDTKLAVYEGCGRCPPDNPIGCNDDWCGLKSSLGPDFGRDPVPVVQGNCYTIRVGGRQGLTGSGNGTMLVECRDESDIVAACCTAGACAPKRQADCVAQQGTWFGTETCGTFSCPIPPPSNDACIDAIELTTGIPFNGTTLASTGTDISSCGDGDTNDIWHSWVADCTGLPTFETCGSQYDTTLAVFNACNGVELGCNDDGCGFATDRIGSVPVLEGQTYYVRVSGFNGETGNYRLTVTGCKSACCIDGGGCVAATPVFCKAGGGVPMVGRLCEGDGNNDGVDDTCAGCPPEPSIINSDPFTGAVDARRPYAQATPLTREGVGTAAEPIFLLLNPGADGLQDCFSLCETAVDPDLGANDIASAVRLPNGLYQLELNHAITAGASTTIRYVGDGSLIDVLSHPGNVNADNIANGQDVISLMDCCISQTCTPAWAERSCDTDRSGARTPLDILTTIDLLLGAGSWDAWNGTAKPSTSACR